MKVGGQILWNVTPICETSQILLSDGKTPYERRFGKPFGGPVVPFGSLVEYHPYNCERSDPNPSIWKESFTWIVPRLRSLRGGIWKGDVLISDLEELETMDASEIYSKKYSMRKR